MRPLTARLVKTFAALDLVFKVLVGLAFLQVMGAGAPGRRDEVLKYIGLIAGPIWLVWITIVAFSARAIDQFVAAEQAGGASAEQIQRAGKAIARLPLWLASLWSAEWCGAFSVVSFAAGAGPSTMAVVLFLSALILGPFPLAHGVTVWLATPLRRSLDLTARKRGVVLDIPRITIRRRLIVYAACIAVAPSAYMAAIGVGARVQLASFESMIIAIMIGFAAVTVFAILTALLVATTFTSPVVDMAEIVRSIARGDSANVGRVPQHQRDELGVLAELTNEMLERLERTQGEREAALMKLEQLANERSRRLQETTHELSQEIAQRARAELELNVARRIQTSVLPQTWKIAGLEIGAKMITASEVGGDYYDILPRPEGGWLAIGDVSGHGVGSGMIMLMLQSVTAALVDAFPQAPPRDIVVCINRVMATNIRQRLQGQDFVTFTLLRYHASGVVHYAGAHEDIIVWRAETGKCELVTTPGPWVGVAADIDATIVDSELKLEPGDLLVLYTDGITEARDKDRHQFDIARLCEAIELHSAEPAVDTIVANVLEIATQWCGVPEDDMSIVVARQC